MTSVKVTVFLQHWLQVLPPSPVPPPQKYFPNDLQSSLAATSKQSTLERSEKARKILLQEYFSSTSRVPEVEGWLWLKDGYKKSWKQTYCILRASGLYYSLKGKQKVGVAAWGLCTDLSIAVAVESMYLTGYLAVPQYQIPS